MSKDAEAVLNEIRDALESRGYAHMANGHDIGRLVDRLEMLEARGGAEQIKQFLRRKYVVRASERQKAMGLAYVEAEISDLAKEIARFILPP